MQLLDEEGSHRTLSGSVMNLAIPGENEFQEELTPEREAIREKAGIFEIGAGLSF